MDVAPAAAEMAVVMGAVVQKACMQQYAAVAAWVWQQAAWIGGAAGGGGRGHDRNGWQPACVQQQAVDVACVQQRAAERHVCDSMQRQQADGSSQQHDCNGRQ